MISIDDKYPLVSIVIPTLNRKEDIVECLDSIQNLDYPKNCLEIIIWDNVSSDGTQGEINRIFADMKKEGWNGLNLIQSDRNLGVYTSRDELFKHIDPEADFILSIDDDVFLPKDSLTVLIKTLQI